MAKSSSAPTISHVAATTTHSTSTEQRNTSSVLKSSFAPSILQLHLFASVIQSVASEQLRIHDTNTSRLRQQCDIKPGSRITCLDWGRYGKTVGVGSQASSQKKRKRKTEDQEDAVVAFGTSTSEICMYSPAQGRIVCELTRGHDKGVRDFKFSPEGRPEAWSVGGDNKLVQWDLSTDQAVRTINMADAAVNVLARPSIIQPAVLCASATPYAIDVSSSDPQIQRFDSFRSNVRSICRSVTLSQTAPDSFLAADDGRTINVFDVKSKRLSTTFLAGSDVDQVDFSSAMSPTGKGRQELMAAVTQKGTVELFSNPFSEVPTTNGELKSKRKAMTRKANAIIQLSTPDRKILLPIVAASIQGPDVVLASVENGASLVFQKIRWQDESTGELLFTGVREVVRTASTTTLKAAVLNGVKDISKSHLDESQVVVGDGIVVANGQESAISISSGSEDETGDEDEDEDESEEDSNAAHVSQHEDLEEKEEGSDGSDSDAEMDDVGVESARRSAGADETRNEAEAEAEPSFGELVARSQAPVAIGDAFSSDKPAGHLSTSNEMVLPTGMSLGTVLTQALRTNDLNLLESCLHANDTGIIQNTIQRLDSSLAAILLSKLAERLASRPGRYGHLLSWVQWTCIAHGGAIAGQPDVAARIRTLYRVLTQRSKSLDRLLLLKGKLDMLDAQLTFRKQLHAQRGHATRHAQDEPATIYIEGEADNWSSEDDHDEVGTARPQKLGFKTRVPLAKRGLEDLIGSSEDESDNEDEHMPLTNGVASDDSEEEEDTDSDSDSQIDADGRRKQPKGIIDVEAEVSGEDESDDDSEEDDDVESGDEDDDGDDEDDEEDSSMADFINDGEVSVGSDDILDDGGESESGDQGEGTRRTTKRLKQER